MLAMLPLPEEEAEEAAASQDHAQPGQQNGEAAAAAAAAAAAMPLEAALWPVGQVRAEVAACCLAWAGLQARV